MRLRPLKVGKCKVDIQSSNDVKPKTRVQGDRLLITPICKCGENLGEHDIADRSDLIIERALSAKSEFEETGKRLTFESDAWATINTSCSKCGRQVTVSIQFILHDRWFKDFNKSRKYGKASLLYRGVLQIDAEITGGFFEPTERRQPYAVADLLNPICGCGTQLQPMQIRNAFERIVKQICEFWESGGEVAPISFEIKEKCVYCFNKRKIKISFTPRLPAPNTPAHKIAKQYEEWKTRVLT